MNVNRDTDNRFPTCYLTAVSREEGAEQALLLRRSFTLTEAPAAATLLITGMGLYRVFLNGAELTKGRLAPYLCDTEQLIPFDRYDVRAHLRRGRNVLAIHLGAAATQGAMRQLRTAFLLTLTGADGQLTELESDTATLTHPSPIWQSRLVAGECYDARGELPGWTLADCNDSKWPHAVEAPAPGGVPFLVTAEPIRTQRTAAPAAILKDGEGWLYDFGSCGTGVCELSLLAEPGQRIALEYLTTPPTAPDPDQDMTLAEDAAISDQRDVYIATGRGRERYLPAFTCHSFRYVRVRGIRAEQARVSLLRAHLFASAVSPCATFTCSDPIANRIHTVAMQADLAHLLYFPTLLGKEGAITAQSGVTLAAEHLLLFHACDSCLTDWLRTVCHAQHRCGTLPATVPGDGESYLHGPLYDSAMITVPYYLWTVRRDRTAASLAADGAYRYLVAMEGLRAPDGLYHSDTGTQVDDSTACPDTATLSLSLYAMGLYARGAALFALLGREQEQQYAAAAAQALRETIRQRALHDGHLLGTPSVSLQAMGLFLDVFDRKERSGAFAALLALLRAGDISEVDALGYRMLFPVLAEGGELSLAYRLITARAQATLSATDPLCCRWDADADTLIQPLPLGEVSAWYLTYAVGLRLPAPRRGERMRTVRIAPSLIPELSYAEGSHTLPEGTVSVRWERQRDGAVLLSVTLPRGVDASLTLPDGWTAEGGLLRVGTNGGSYRLVRKK